MRALFLFFSLFLLSACNDSAPSSTTDSAEVPEQIAVKFFEALLVNNDLKAAQTYAVPSLGRVLQSFSSAKAASRTLLNIKFDEVTITIEDTNKSVREFYTDKADVMLIFTGTYDGGKRVDMRMVKMVAEKGKWLISEIKPDPFARAGT
ncbi:hypothetical protein EOE67_09315 [Rheinheimera riviphila]|uniref:DUF4878 domain-containing protein n=1 Tax=Rheinheimera riviphila TaxID=1834037 RepID=A0A437QT49_9GAMM|nr:hypothetical protein [Rheinheimera riviphila]RVU37664.1 hypothetical protein EOE67_09315 [Rheinheimera riviphila]